MADKSFELTVVTPDEAVLETRATFVALPAHDGEVGILVDRAPLLVKLGVGVLRAETDDGAVKLYVDGGFAEMVGDRLTVLTEDARQPEVLDASVARQALDEALARRAVADEEFHARQRAIQRARTQLKLTK